MSKLTPGESLARCLTEVTRPIYAVIRTADPKTFAYDETHKLGEVVTWSVSKRGARDGLSKLWCPELYSIVRLQPVT